jgi:ribosomal subunit interface protein
MTVRFTAVGFDLDAELDKYAARKVAHMSRHVPRKEKADAVCEVQFTHGKRKGIKYSTCAITFKLHEANELKAEETTQHMYAALDIAAVRIEQQLEDFAKRQKKHRVRNRLKRHFGTE